MTIHIGARPGDIAETVLMPGDPYRARWAAETFLENPRLVNEVRGMLGFTGTWRGHPVTIHGSGMGMPSLSIYANELIRDFGARCLIRVGSAGGMQGHVALRDLVLATTASSIATPSQSMFREMNFAPAADFGLLRAAWTAATARGLPIHAGGIYSSDTFYDERPDLNEQLQRHGVLCVEMETAELYTLAARHKARALAILTISDHLLTHQALSSADRERSFGAMVEIAGSRFRMKQRQLGSGGPMVSALGLGCMSFGGIFGPTDDAASLRCLDAALDHGITFLDTANIYGMGISETVIGRFLRRRRPQVTLATKAGIVGGPDRRFDNSAEHLRAELHASLRRLGTDHVDLFYIHRREEARPVEEVVETLKSLIEEGKIGGYGLSEVSPGTLRRAHAVHPCRAVQNEYSLWTRLPDLGLIQTCDALGTAFVPFSPLARGVLGAPPVDPAALPTGDFRLSIPRFREPDWSLNARALAPFRAFCAARGWTVPAAALAWILDRGPHLIPIPGTRSADHLAAWCAAPDIAFTDADRAEIARLLPAGFAHGDRYGLDQAMTVERYC